MNYFHQLFNRRHSDPPLGGGRIVIRFNDPSPRTVGAQDDDGDVKMTDGIDHGLLRTHNIDVATDLSEVYGNQYYASVR